MGNYVPKGEESVKFNLNPKKEDPKNEENKKEFEKAYKKQKNNTLIKRIIGLSLAGCVAVGSAGALVYKNYKSNHPFEGELINITNNDEYRELKKEWKNNRDFGARDLLTTPQQLKDDLRGYLNTVWDLGSIYELVGTGEDIYMICWLESYKGSVTSMYKYHVGKDIIQNFKSFDNVSSGSGDDYFNYLYLIKHVIDNYKGELIAQNYGADNTVSEVNGNQGTFYDVSEENGKYAFIKKTGTLPDFVLSTIISYKDGMLVHGLIDTMRVETVEQIGELEFLGSISGMKYVNSGNEYTK